MVNLNARGFASGFFLGIMLRETPCVASVLVVPWMAFLLRETPCMASVLL